MGFAGLKSQEKHMKTHEQYSGKIFRLLLTWTCADQMKLPSKVNITEVVYQAKM